ncbi:hypothetical protein HK101_001616 [Irineochytrium annulatum]|nr:hypothetical protein HK101_001616 [Irineochytrium annulatum]
MRSATVIAAVAAVLASLTAVNALAPLEPADGQVLIGSWFARPNKDTPSATNARIAPVALNFFQIDIDISGGKTDTLLSYTPEFIRQLVLTKTSANAYLTVYPFGGFDNVTNAQLDELAKYVSQIVSLGRQVFLRYAPEMNGDWFVYGQDPAAFIAGFRHFVTYMRTAVGEQNVGSVAFIWAPNSGNGYPFGGGDFAANPTWIGGEPPKPQTEAMRARTLALDTNGDQNLTIADDPFYPYYPGDEFVDWVGISIYHYGIEYPWINNVVPPVTEFESFMAGNDSDPKFFGTGHFYEAFSGTGLGNNNVSAGGKPFIVAETGATYHFDWSPLGLNCTPGSGGGCKDPNNKPSQTLPRLDLKRAWWSSFLNADFIAKYPRFKAVCFFEFVKTEEWTWRDFSSLGPPSAEFAQVDAGIAEAFAADMKAAPFITGAAPADGTVPAWLMSEAAGATATAPPASAATSTAAKSPPAQMQTTGAAGSASTVGVTTVTTKSGGGRVAGVGSGIMILGAVLLSLLI